MLRRDEEPEVAGAVSILLVGLVHLFEAPEHFEYGAYLGFLFLLNVILAAIVAVGINWGAKGWG